MTIGRKIEVSNSVGIDKGFMLSNIVVYIEDQIKLRGLRVAHQLVVGSDNFING